MLDGPLDSLTEADVKRLVDEKVAERKVLEYKAQLPGHLDASRKEFLADVSSFANSAGGHLLFGISEARGIPVRLGGLENVDSDATILRLEGIIRDGLDPRVPGVHTASVSLSNGNHVLIIRVPRSWAAPHLVKFQGSSRFYARNSAGKYQMDVGEIRAAFVLSQGAAQRIRNFRADRLSKIVAGDTPAALPGGAKAVLHVIPVLTGDERVVYDVRSIPINHLPPLTHSGWSHRHNFDGVLTFSWEGSTNYAYLQVFNHGAFEAVDAELLAPNGEEKIIPSAALESSVMEALGAYLQESRKLGVQLPVLVMFTLLGVRNYILGVAKKVERRGDMPIDRDSLVFPDILVEDYDTDPSEVLKPTFDMLWNAAGFRRCFHYDADGKWKC